MITIENNELHIIFKNCDAEETRKDLLRQQLFLLRLYSLTEDLYEKDYLHLFTCYLVLRALLNLEDEV